MNRELITNAWSKKDTKNSVNITQFFNNFNKNAFYFCWFILNLSNPEERARGLEYLIDIAQHCVLLGNFSCFMQIMSAIEHTSISRLKNSWQFISKHVSTCICGIFLVQISGSIGKSWHAFGDEANHIALDGIQITRNSKFSCYILI